MSTWMATESVWQVAVGTAAARHTSRGLAHPSENLHRLALVFKLIHRVNKAVPR